MDPVVHRVVQRLGWKRRPLGCGLRVQRTQRQAPAARASPEQRSCFIEPLRRQKIERRAVRGNLEENGAVAAGVPAVGSPHDVENLQQVLLVGGVHRLAAGPEAHAAPRHAEEPSDLVPGQSRRSAQFRDRAAREPGCILGKPVLVCEHGPVTIARRFEPAKESVRDDPTEESCRGHSVPDVKRFVKSSLRGARRAGRTHISCRRRTPP